MPKRCEEKVRRVLPTGSENVRRRLDLEAGEGTSAQRDPPVRRPRVDARVPALTYGSGAIQTTPQKHHGVLKGIRRRMGGMSDLDIDGYIMQMERDQEDEVPRVSVRDEWSSEDDITLDEDSGDEYLPPGATGGGERESDLDFSGFSAFEEEEAQLYEPDPDSDNDGESEGDGPVQQRGKGGRARRKGRGRGRAAPPAGSDSDEGWSEDPTPPVMHPFTVAPVLTVPVPATPLGFVQLFLTRELLEYLVAETSDSARYCRVELKKTLSYIWRGCNLKDIANYLGLQVFFGLIHASDVRLYWKRNFFMDVPNVASLMTRDTFLALDRYFHAFNRRAIPRGNKDRLIVARPVLEYIRDRCKTLIVPSKNLSFDEGMMPYKGRLSIKVYNPKKPKKYGVKFFFITESNTGYVLDFSIYSGVFSMLRDTVFGLVDRFRNQGYHLFMDNYYNSVSLAQELYD